MQRFFSTIDAIDRFTHSLDSQTDTLRCHQCRAGGQLVSHGFVYKQRSQTITEPVGKRVLCSNRYGRTGCGHTFQLYIASEVPSLQYGATQLAVFIAALLANFSVTSAYRSAVGHAETRHAWRWLNRLMRRLMDYRCIVSTRTQSSFKSFSDRCRRLQLLLPTLATLFDAPIRCPCSDFHNKTQSRFI